MNLARLDAPAGRLAEAHATLKHLLEHAPRNVDALHLLARIQEAQGDMESLQETLARLAEVDPEGASQVP